MLSKIQKLMIKAALMEGCSNAEIAKTLRVTIHQVAAMSAWHRHRDSWGK